MYNMSKYKKTVNVYPDHLQRRTYVAILKSKREQITRVVSLPPSLFCSEILVAACATMRLEIDVCWMTSLICFYQTCDRKMIPSSSSSSSTVIIIKSSQCSRVSRRRSAALFLLRQNAAATEKTATTWLTPKGVNLVHSSWKNAWHVRDRLNRKSQVQTKKQHCDLKQQQQQQQHWHGWLPWVPVYFLLDWVDTETPSIVSVSAPSSRLCQN